MAIDVNTIKVGVVDALRAALAERRWDVYAVGATGVIRSPDRKVFIISTHCTVQDIVLTVNRWQPPLKTTARDN
jgi:hypothetical protein